MTSDQEAKQLDSVTDRVQEKEMDELRTRDAMSALSSSSVLALSTESHLAAIEVSKGDIETLVFELEITDDAAERMLKLVVAEGIPQGESALSMALERLITS